MYTQQDYVLSVPLCGGTGSNSGVLARCTDEGRISLVYGLHTHAWMYTSRKRRAYRMLWSLLLLLHLTEGTRTDGNSGRRGEDDGLFFGKHDYSSARREPWLPARMLEISLSTAATADGPGSAEDQTVEEVVRVRFDALLVDPADLAARILTVEDAVPEGSGFPAADDREAERKKSYGPSHAGERDRSEIGRVIVIAAAAESFRRAADLVYDEMEAELLWAATRDAEGDWLENADATCITTTFQRRQEILEVYRDGMLSLNSVACTEPRNDSSGMIRSCQTGLAAQDLARDALAGQHLMDTESSLAACRELFRLSEMEYAKAACLRAARLGGLSDGDMAEVDMGLAAVASLHGHPSAAMRLYYHVMGRSSTTESGRLAIAIMGLSMVPPQLLGSPLMVEEFREDWTTSLRTLEHQLRTGIRKGELWDPHIQVGSTPFHLAHQGGSDLELLVALTGVYDAAAPMLRFVAPHCERAADGRGEKGVARRPARIGFFSLHLQNHSIGRMMALLIVHLSEDPDFEVHVFGPDGDSGYGDEKDKSSADQVVEALRGVVHNWHKAPRMLDEARTAVAQQELDVLVYPDIGMDSLTYFMAFARLAPVQCVWWGHPVTPGTAAIDYFLSLDTETEEGQADYLEQMVRMDIMNTAPFRQVQSMSEPSVVAHHDTEAVSGILAKDPDGCVLLIHEMRDEEWTRAVWRRLGEKLTAEGSNDRLQIIHYWHYPEALRGASAVLDTFPYGGCLTVLEALSNGVPVVTFPANAIRGRFALAIYEQMGFTDLVADDVEGYAALAVKLGTNNKFRKQVLEKLHAGHRLSLHKNGRSAREWGAFFSRALRS